MESGAIVNPHGSSISTCRGQGGFTLIEIVVAFLVGTVVVGAALGLLTTLLRTQNSVDRSNQDVVQFNLIRSRLQRDWERAQIIRVRPTGSSAIAPAQADGLECNNAGSFEFEGASYVPSTYAPFQVTNGLGNELLFTIQSVERVDDVERIRRTVYALRHKSDGTKELWRRRCERTPTGVMLTATAATGWWSTDSASMGYGCSSGTFDCGTQPSERIARGISSVITQPPGCNVITQPNRDYQFEPCDIDVTVTGQSGRSSTIRLFQRGSTQYSSSGRSQTLVVRP